MRGLSKIKARAAYSANNFRDLQYLSQKGTNQTVAVVISSIIRAREKNSLSKYVFYYLCI